MASAIQCDRCGLFQKLKSRGGSEGDNGDLIPAEMTLKVQGRVERKLQFCTTCAVLIGEFLANKSVPATVSPTP